MPVFLLTDDLVFPPVELADEYGRLAIGGDLSPERLLLAYSSGIFPWYNPGEPILWWSPDPRFVIYPEKVRVPRSMRRVFNRKEFTVTLDTRFREVITACSRVPRPYQDGTWITDEMVEAYCELHRQGYAHSVETWKDGDLAGGLYGISLGRAFFGESMFSQVSNASKVAFYTLNRLLLNRQFHFIDSQVHNEHMEMLGGVFVHREHYIQQLKEGLKAETYRGNWGEMFGDDL